MIENSSHSVIAAIIDTNLLIHGRPLEELPWLDVAPGVTDIEVQVGITVLRELDRHKSDGNSRRARRAKAAGSLFGEIRTLPGRIKELRGANPRVVLRLLPRVPIPWDAHPELDRTHADDVLVAEALAHKVSDRQTIIVSHDNGLLLTADQLGLATFAVPDAWLLQPEGDEKEKQVKSLQAQIAALKAERNEPELALDFVDDNDAPITNIQVFVPQIVPLTDAGIDAAMKEVRRRWPLAQVKLGQPAPSQDQPASAERIAFDIAGFGWRGPTATDITQYNQDYESFLQSFRILLKSLQPALIENSRFSQLSWRLINNGKVPAEGLELSITTVGGLVMRKECPEWKRPKKPSAPRPPKITDLNERLGIAQLFTGSSIPLLSPHTLPKPRDSQAFYWDASWRCVYRDIATLTCDDFRHGKAHTSSLAIGFPTPNTLNGKGAVKVSVSARNMPKALSKVLSVSVEPIQCDLVEMLRTAGCPDDVIEFVEIARA